MQETVRGFSLSAAVLCILLSIAAAIYSSLKGIPAPTAIALLPAFLIEAVLYMIAGTPGMRAVIVKQFEPPALAFMMIVSACLPYVFYSSSAGVFEWTSMTVICAMVTLASGWYLIGDARPSVDTGFLLLMAAPVLLRVFPVLYADPVPDLRISILGTLMWARTGILAVLLFRKMEGVEFSFLPARREAWIGIRNFVLFLPLGVLIAIQLDFARVKTDAFSWRTLGLALVTFIGVLWVLAAIEEFFFRGLLQQWLSRGLRSEWLGLIAASVIFGAAHLGYRQFPNWRFALLATVAGLFYGQAFREGKGIRAAMVTHALVVTTWQVFLS